MRLWGNNADHGTKRKRTLAVRRGFAPRVSRSRSSQGPRAGRARDGDRVVQGGAFRPAATCSGPSGEAMQTGGLRPALRDSSARPGRARADNVRLSPGPRRRPPLVCGAPGPRAETKQCVTGSGTHHGLFAVPVSEEREKQCLPQPRQRKEEFTASSGLTGPASSREPGGTALSARCPGWDEGLHGYDHTRRHYGLSRRGNRHVSNMLETSAALPRSRPSWDQSPTPHVRTSAQHSGENGLLDKRRTQGPRSTFEKRGHEESATT